MTDRHVRKVSEARARGRVFATLTATASRFHAAPITIAVLSLALAGAPVHAQIGLYEIARFNIGSTSNAANPEFIGSNPIAVGWNGSKLYVAGFNGSSATANTSIIEITNAGSGVAQGGFVTPTYSAAFGGLSSTASRGYTGLAMKGGQLAASWDINTNQASSIQMFDTTTNTLSWNLSATGTTTAYIQGKAGPDFDPGWKGDPAQGSGLAYLNQGSGARGLSNSTSGAMIYSNPSVTGATRGMFLNATGTTSTAWRDIAFDPVSGDVYTRLNNQVTRANRTSANSVESLAGVAGNSTIIVPATSNNQVGTNIGFMNAVTSSTFNSFTNAYAGDLLVFNDRASTLAGQSWTNVIKFATTSGSSVTPTWTFLSAPSTGVAAYDFEWDSASQTLAVVDYTNRNVSIFSTAVPEPSTWAMAGVAGSALAGQAVWRTRRKKRRGAGTADQGAQDAPADDAPPA